MTLLNDVSDVCVWAVFCSAVTFAILYTLKASWWHSWMGRNLFLMDSCVALAMVPSVAQMAFGVNTDTHGYQWLIVGVIGFVALLIMHRIYMLLRVQSGWTFRVARDAGDNLADLYHRMLARRKKKEEGNE